MATARKLKNKKGLHIEADLCIVNIYEGLRDTKGRKVTTIEIIPDEYIGEPKKQVVGSRYIRVIELKKKER